MYIGGSLLQGVQRQSIDAVESQRKGDPQQRRQEESAEDRKDGMGDEELNR